MPFSKYAKAKPTYFRARTWALCALELTMGYYDVAEVCPNGHVSTSSANSSPEFREKFCSQCGEETTTKCSNCNESIRGYYHSEGFISVGYEFEPPSFCFNCGTAFPWTQRKIDGAMELLREGANLSEEELQQFENDLKELTKDSPKVQVSSIRFKKVMGKAGVAIAGGIKEIVVDVLSEAAKKALWGP